MAFVPGVQRASQNKLISCRVRLPRFHFCCHGFRDDSLVVIRAGHLQFFENLPRVLQWVKIFGRGFGWHLQFFGNLRGEVSNPFPFQFPFPFPNPTPNPFLVRQRVNTVNPPVNGGSDTVNGGSDRHIHPVIT